MNSVKKISCMLIAVALVLGLCACGASGNKSINIDDAMSKITSSVQMPESIMTLANSSDLMDYFQVDSAYINDYTAIINPSNVGFELIIIEAKDASAASEVVSQLNNYKTERVETYSSYNADYASLLENSSINVNGVYVSMFVAENSAEILSVYNSLFE